MAVVMAGCEKINLELILDGRAFMRVKRSLSICRTSIAKFRVSGKGIHQAFQNQLTDMAIMFRTLAAGGYIRHDAIKYCYSFDPIIER